VYLNILRTYLSCLGIPKGMPKKSVVTPFEKSKENRSYEFKRAISHYYISANEVRGELKTIGTADVKHICYATETMTLE